MHKAVPASTEHRYAAGMLPMITKDDLSELEQDDNPKVRVLVQLTRELAKDYLFYYTRHLAYMYLHSPTHPDMPMLLWRAVEEGPQVMTEEEVGTVAVLADTAQGWWRYLGTPTEQPLFVPMDEWLQEYRLRARPRP